MIKDEFKRVFTRFFVRIIILIGFLIVCYFASFMCINKVEAKTIMENGYIRADTNEVSLGIYQNNQINSYWYGNNTNTHPTLTYWNNVRVYTWVTNKSVSGQPLKFEVNLSTDYEDKNSLVFNVYAPSNLSSVSSTYGNCEISTVPYYVNSDGDIYNNAYQVHCNNLTPTSNPGIKIKLSSANSVNSNNVQFTMGAPFFYSDDLHKTNMITSEILDATNGLNQKIEESNNFQKSQDTSGAQNGGTSYFDNFENPISSTGLSGIVGAPITLLNNLLTGTCTPLHLTIPFVNKEFDLPCMSTIYENNFGTFLQVYRVITFGIITYWVIIKCIGIVKNLVDPDDDKIEVLDL